jgi:xanthine/CO dehydrogenase XdhC/CoxF family maturation factor
MLPRVDISPSKHARQDDNGSRPVRRRTWRHQGRRADLTEVRDSGGCAVRVVVTQKVAAQALPVVGALGGAAVNYAFIEHFQDVARGHFTVRRLERIYGKERIRAEYDLIAAAL